MQVGKRTLFGCIEVVEALRYLPWLPDRSFYRHDRMCLQGNLQAVLDFSFLNPNTEPQFLHRKLDLQYYILFVG